MTNPNDPTAYIAPRSTDPVAGQKARQAPSTLAYSEQYPAYAAEPSEPHYDNTTGDSAYQPPAPKRQPVDLGVDLPKYVGSAVVAAIVAALLAYLGVLLVNTIATWIPDTYWLDRNLIRPEHSPATAAWLAGASAIVAAGTMWILLTLTARTGMFFTAITTLIGAIGFLTILSTGPWQTTIGIAALFALTAAVIGGLTGGYTRLCTTRPERY